MEERSERSKIEAAVAAGQPSPPPTPLSLPGLPLTGGERLTAQPVRRWRVAIAAVVTCHDPVGGVLARSVPSTRESSAEPKWWPAATSRKRVRNPTTTCFATRTARCTFRTRAAAFGAGHERTRTRTTRQSVVGCRSIQNEFEQGRGEKTTTTATRWRRRGPDQIEATRLCRGVRGEIKGR